jgi:hypothetical protein
MQALSLLFSRYARVDGRAWPLAGAAMVPAQSERQS